MKIPHMGWNSVTFRRKHPVFAGYSDPAAEFYFVHSYYPSPSDEISDSGHNGLWHNLLFGAGGQIIWWPCSSIRKKAARPGLADSEEFLRMEGQ
ncbi:MAG: hypothetical protein MZU91_09805 [Desulfosudis oleivorans]|nr:hypothetical protein [Desulfosudis oleivorans]